MCQRVLTTQYSKPWSQLPNWSSQHAQIQHGCCSPGCHLRGPTSVPLGTPRLSPLCLAEDWSAERPFTGFQLGDILNIQAEVSTESHVPLRLFVDSCVAALSPDGDSSPHYSIIDFNG